MNYRTLFIAALLLVLPIGLHAQFPPGGPAGPPRPPREAAPIDITGYWVSLVTEDWRFRMVSPPKGDVPNVPLNPEGRKIANAWDPAKDEAAGEQCKAYGAANIMRVPGRLNITWENDTTLKIQTDAGTQTRLLRFGNQPAPAGDPAWQGHSAAQWEGRLFPRGNAPRSGHLRVVTTRMRPGYLQRNGAPYGANAVMTEYFDLVKEPNGDQLLIVKSIVEDPQYLIRSFIRSTHFKKQANAAGWNPAACSAR